MILVLILVVLVTDADTDAEEGTAAGLKALLLDDACGEGRGPFASRLDGTRRGAAEEEVLFSDLRAGGGILVFIRSASSSVGGMFCPS